MQLEERNDELSVDPTSPAKCHLETMTGMVVAEFVNFDVRENPVTATKMELIVLGTVLS